MVALVMAIMLVTAKPAVSLTVRGLTGKQRPSDIARRVRSHEYVCATIELRNGSDRPVSWWTPDAGESVNCILLHQTPAGWKEPAIDRHYPFGLELQTLAPGEAVTFEAVVDSYRPCKVAITYWDDRARTRVGQRLPRWLGQRWPWGMSWRTITTETIDVAHSKVRSNEGVRGFSWAPVAVPEVRAAAKKGNLDAQFRLAGMYWSGNGLEKSVAEALWWYESAAWKGHAEAAYILGTIYEQGLGVPAHRAQAIEWYRRSSVQGHALAEDRLQQLASK